ncbi:phosphotransferase [Candidatus Saccharibacteria bacterium]|nr:phosphotransferase [Candidatus Saccharibacteria bacterium]MCB9821591.1 phosphotransferase [Candidatus Nomurabacteria bacterium]
MINKLQKPHTDYLLSLTTPDKIKPAEGGHMAYYRLIAQLDEQKSLFAKAYHPNLLTDPHRQSEMLEFLAKEASIYEHLHKHGFSHTVGSFEYIDGMLLLEGLTAASGWHWRAPRDNLNKYIADAEQAFTKLEQISPPSLQILNENVLGYMFEHGWNKIHPGSVTDIITAQLKRWEELLHPDFMILARSLGSQLENLRLNSAPVGTVLNHHDARQANLAWHPERGTRVVDWSWAHLGLNGADMTMLLIDLHKSGYDINKYKTKLNKTYARLLIGYWLKHSTDPHPEASEIVRMHQFISAITAAELLL